MFVYCSVLSLEDRYLVDPSCKESSSCLKKYLDISTIGYDTLYYLFSITTTIIQIFRKYYVTFRILFMFNFNIMHTVLCQIVMPHSIDLLKGSVYYN